MIIIIEGNPKLKSSFSNQVQEKLFARAAIFYLYPQPFQHVSRELVVVVVVVIIYNYGKLPEISAAKPRHAVFTMTSCV